MNRTAFTLMALSARALHAEPGRQRQHRPGGPGHRLRQHVATAPGGHLCPPPRRTSPSPAALRLRPPPGSLYSAASYRPSFEDRRARLVGDLVTIQIVETVTGQASLIVHSGPQLRSQRRRHGLAVCAKATLTDKLSLGASSGNTFSGKGGTESANTFQGSITATVIDVLPNGHLVVAGEKQIGVNQKRGRAAVLRHRRPARNAAGQRHQLHPGGQCARGVAWPGRAKRSPGHGLAGPLLQQGHTVLNGACFGLLAR